MHIVEPNEYTTHGYFSRELSPILRIDSGETIRYRNMYDARWQGYDGETKLLKQSPLREADPLKGHCLLGPVAIRGAKPGMVLEVQVGEIQVAPMGWNTGGGGDDPVLNGLGVGGGDSYIVSWHINAANGTAHNDLKQRVHLRPFLGVMGMPPDEPGQLSTTPPRSTGGNMDCKLLVTGSSLFLPIAVDGGLFSAGDGHAVQGDGEISGTAIECPIEQVDLTFILHENMSLETPRARTPEGWITLGFDEDLDTATMIALRAMLDLMEVQFGITRKDAFSLASLVVDLRITQIVNTTKGVHAVLPNGAVE
jgi:acetamidase/formamidase